MIDLAEQREQRIDEWTEMLYRLHLSRTGTLPTVDRSIAIKSALRHVAVKLIDGDTETFERIVNQYGHLRQGAPEVPGTGRRRP